MEQKTNINQEEFNYAQDVITKLSKYYDEKVVGQQGLKLSLIAGYRGFTFVL